MKASISELFLTARTAIDNATAQPEILKNMGLYGFNQKRLQEGKALLENAIMLHDAKDGKYDEHNTVSEQTKADQKAARSTYMRHLEIAKIAFSNDPDMLRRLKPKPVSNRIAEWTNQARVFYIKVLPFAAQMEKYQVSQAEMQQAQAMIDAYLSSRNKRLQKKGEAEEATSVRNKAIKALRAWMSQFHSVARVALSENPQLLEALGVTVSSGKKASKTVTE